MPGQPSADDAIPQRRQSRIKRFLTLEPNNLFFLLGLAVIIAIVMVSWWAVLGMGPDGRRMTDNGQPETRQQAAAESVSLDPLEARIKALNERTEMLTDSITYLESKLIRAHVLVDSIITDGMKLNASGSREQPVTITDSPADNGPSRSRQPDTVAANSTTPPAPREQPQMITRPVTDRESAMPLQTDTAASEKPAPDNPRSVNEAAKQPQPPRSAQPTATTEAPAPKRSAASQTPPADSTGPDKPWVINLISSPSRADADRFAETARVRGVATQQQQVEVKGKQYWRVQIAGFASAAEARSSAGIVRKQLGLKDVWITRR